MQYVKQKIYKKIAPYIRFISKNIVYSIFGFMQKYMNGYISFLKKDVSKYNDELEDIFVTKQNISVPVYKNYRKSVKNCLTYFGSINAITILKNESKLSSKEHLSLFEEFTNTRTLVDDIKNINKIVGDLCLLYKDMFLNIEQFIFKPNYEETLLRVDEFVLEHKSMINKLKSFNIYLDKNYKKLLEIGFVSGVYSIFAFEKLGFEVYGIDNCYVCCKKGC